MPAEEYVKIGYVARTHGVKGAVIIKLHLPKLPEQLPEAFFIQGGSVPVPYFMEALLASEKDTVTVKLEDIDSKETAQALVGQTLLLPLENIDDAFLADDRLIGFRIMDAALGTLGTVEDILEMPMQRLVQLTYKGKEVLFPLNEQTLLRIDQTKKTLYVSLPEGLLDIYLEPMPSP